MKNPLRNLFAALRKKEQKPQPKPDIRQVARKNMEERDARYNQKAREERIQIQRKLEKLFRSVPDEAKNGCTVRGRLGIKVDYEIYKLFEKGSRINTIYHKELDDFLRWMKGEYNVSPAEIRNDTVLGAYYLEIDLRLNI